MATPLQRLCLRARPGRPSAQPQPHTNGGCSNVQAFHTSQCRARPKPKLEDSAPTKMYPSSIKPKRKPLNLSKLDAPRLTSTRHLLDAFEDSELSQKKTKTSKETYKQFLEQYGQAISLEHPEGYDEFVKSSGIRRMTSQQLDLSNESQRNRAKKRDEQVSELTQRHFRDINPVRGQYQIEPVGWMSQGDVGGEEKEWQGPDEVFEADDLTSLGHGYLEQHREVREYYRWAAWELPLLTQYAKEFVPPSSDMPLRFRYTSYMGEKHPAEKKVVLEFCTADLPLTPKQRLKLVKLLGSRYNPQKDLAKMSCESFPEPLQNKRYLADLVDNLLAEARLESTAEGGKDAFEDVPTDFRHVKWKTPPKFPDAWKMTVERREKLFQGWTAEVGRSQQALLQGTTVDGVKTIAHFLGAKAVEEPARQPVRVR